MNETNVVMSDPSFSLIEVTAFTADHCIKCNICTSACPYAKVTPLFPGPKVVGPQWQRLRDPDADSPDHSLDYCSGCGSARWFARTASK